MNTSIEQFLQGTRKVAEDARARKKTLQAAKQYLDYTAGLEKTAACGKKPAKPGTKKKPITKTAAGGSRLSSLLKLLALTGGAAGTGFGIEHLANSQMAADAEAQKAMENYRHPVQTPAAPASAAPKAPAGGDTKERLVNAGIGALGGGVAGGLANYLGTGDVLPGALGGAAVGGAAGGFSPELLALLGK